MNVGIIGTGRHGSRYAEHIVNDCPELNLTAIARRSETGRKQARSWRCQWFADWRELVRSASVEAVICAVPPVRNLAIATWCGRYGKPLLLEKPLAVDAIAGAELVRRMRESGVALTVGQTLRYNPVIRRLREELPSLGTLYTIYANQRLEPSTLDWLDDPSEAGAGITLHIGVHVFDALRFVTGLKVTRVSAACRTVRANRLADQALIRMELENKVSGLVDISRVSGARSGRYEFSCSHGQLHGDQIHGYVNCLAGSVETQLEPCQPIPTIPPLLREWHHFLAGDGPNPVTGEDGLYAIRVSDACLESSSNDRWVAVGPGRFQENAE